MLDAPPRRMIECRQKPEKERAAAMNKKHPDAPRRANYLTVLSVLSALAVVTLHANGVFWRFDAQAPYWRSANVIESACYFAVPMFFMITGATLIGYRDRYGTAEYCKKRLLKTALPFAFWTVCGTLFRLIMKEFAWTDMTPRFLIEGFLNSKLIGVYWFFFPLFGVYACIPLLSAVEKSKRRSVFAGTAAVCFAVNCLLPFLFRVTGSGLTVPFSVGVGSGYLFYVLTGWLLADESPKRSVRFCIYALGAASIFAATILTARLSVAAGAIVDLYKGYNNVPCVFCTLALFTLVKQIAPSLLRRPAVEKAFAKLGAYTFAVYLLHWYVLDLLVKLPAVDEYALWYRLGAPVPVFLVCAAAAFLIRKLPGGSRILP